MEIPWFLGIILAYTSNAKTHLAKTREGRSVRALVKTMNRLIEEMDLEGLQQLVRQQPREAVIAANYVNKKYRYVAQNAVLEELERKRRGVTKD